MNSRIDFTKLSIVREQQNACTLDLIEEALKKKQMPSFRNESARLLFERHYGDDYLTFLEHVHHYVSKRVGTNFFHFQHNGSCIHGHVFPKIVRGEVFPQGLEITFNG